MLIQHSERTFRQSLLAMLGICFVIMMVALDQTVVATALPTIVAELHGFELYAWVSTAYLLASVVTIPIFGRLGDYYGRKPFVVVAIVTFTLASVLCAMASNMLLLVLARALQGIGGGMLVGTAFACIPDLFPDSKTRLQWQVMLSAAYGIANAIGPSIGGLLTHYVSWRAVFFVNIPVGLMSVFFVSRFLPRLKPKHTTQIRLDWLGALLITLFLGCLQLSVEWLPKQGLSGPVIYVLLTCLAAGFLAWKQQANNEHAILPFALFKDPTLAALFRLSLLMGFAMFALLSYAPLLLQGGFHLSASRAGMLITPLVVCITFASIINGRIVPHLPKPEVMLYLGFGLLLICVTGIMNISPQTAHSLIICLMMSGGLGLGFIMPNLTIFVQETCPRKDLGISTALLQSLRMIGGMLSTALVGSILNWRYEHDINQQFAKPVASLLNDPQVLVNVKGQHAAVLQMNALGEEGLLLIEQARAILSSAIQSSQWLGIAATLFAFWCLRSLPQIRFKPQGA
ncbi:MFS transporter [Iodobacter ciconiae]|nr:MFS transporter [Iodobacter ciconiae]